MENLADTSDGIRLRKGEEWPTHDDVVNVVASRKLSYPNKTHPEWKTETNPDQEKNFYVQSRNGDKLYPDVVVHDTKAALMIGEVETESTVNDESAEQWSDYSGLVSDFYLYVPEGTEDDAAQLLQSNRIACSGLRAYSVVNGNVTFSDVS